MLYAAVIENTVVLVDMLVTYRMENVSDLCSNLTPRFVTYLFMLDNSKMSIKDQIKMFKIE